MKKIITSADIDQLVREGKREIYLDGDVVITSFAAEVAQKFNINIIDRRKGQTNNSVIGTYSNPLMDEKVINEWRKEFPILEKAIHVGNCSQAPQARRVRKAINDYLDNWLTIGMNWDYWCEEVVKAKKEFAKLINADVSEIAVCSSLSEAAAGLISSFSFDGPRNKIVATEAEFPTVGHVLLAHQKLGIRVDFVPLEDGKVKLEDYDRYIDESTLLTVATHVFYQNGFKQDIAAIAKKAHAKGSYLFVDCYQSIGTIPIDVKALDIDFLATGTLKYLLGIPGIAFLYVRKELIPLLKPIVTGWFGQENPFSFKVRILDYARDARRFDTGTPPVIAGFAAKAGLEIINEVNPVNIHERIQFLSKICIEGALRRGLEVVSPLDVQSKGSTTAIRVPDSHAAEVALKERGIIASARGNVIRIAPHFFTTSQDIEIVLDELANILSKPLPNY